MQNVNKISILNICLNKRKMADEENETFLSITLKLKKNEEKREKI